MSLLQDESFPMDELLDELSFSPLPNIQQRFSFAKQQQKQQVEEAEEEEAVRDTDEYLEQQDELQQMSNSTTSNSAASTNSNSHSNSNSNSNTSSSSSHVPSTAATTTDSNSSRNNNGSSNNNNSFSREVENDGVGGFKRCRAVLQHQQQHQQQPTAANSYQDIHSEYTKRRFKHVASKVGEYIANMKAEENKRRRRAHLERHLSLPETLAGSGCRASRSSAADILLIAGEQKFPTLHFSANELQRRGVGGIYESDNDNNNGDGGGGDDDDGVDDGDDDDDYGAAEADIESAANTSATTSASAATSATNSNNNNNNRSNEHASDSIDKELYAQLLHEKERIQSYSEYLQSKLDEKNSENMRLKRNVDYLRIELTNCQDKLKQRDKASKMGGGGGGGGFGSRLALPTTLHCYQLPALTEQYQSKETQTEQMTTTPPPPPPLPMATHELIYVTPDTPDAINNKTALFDASTANAAASKSGKTVATIQPLSLNFSTLAERETCAEACNEGNEVCLRKRTNSNTFAKYKVNTNNNNNNNRLSNNNRNLCCPESRRSGGSSRSSADSAIDLELAFSPPHKFKNNKARPAAGGQQRGERICVNNNNNNPNVYCADTNFGDGSQSAPDIAANNDSPRSAELSSVSTDAVVVGRKTKKRKTLRQRWLRLLGKCTRCSSNDQQTLDNSSAQQTYAQIPLLEKSFENHCRNVR